VREIEVGVGPELTPDLTESVTTGRTAWQAQALRPFTSLMSSTKAWGARRNFRPLAMVQAITAGASGHTTDQAQRLATANVQAVSTQRTTPAVRRKRLSGARRLTPTTRARFSPEVVRAGFHGIMVAIGVAAAVTVWNGATEQHPYGQPDVSVAAATDAADSSDGALVALVNPADTTGVPTSTRMQPLTRKVADGDTIRSIAAEYSVSMSTILASNKFDNPDMIQPGQDILIPPVDGVVTDVKEGETLGQVAERFGAQVEDVALANALPAEAEQAIPFERIVVPGRETAERAMSVARGESGDSTNVGSVSAAAAAKPESVTYEVQEGDTIGQLATQFGVTSWTILSANDLDDADTIRPGMKLKVLAVNGVEHEIQAGESLSDIAAFYKVDLGPLIDFNAVADPDSLRVGPQPGFSLAGAGTGEVLALAVPAAPSTAAQRPAPSAAVAQAKPQAKPATQAAAKPQAKPAVQAASKPQAPAARGSTNNLQAAAVSAPVSIVTGGAGGSGVVSAAMRHLGARYVFGGTSPSGFDCSGFVWYVHKALGKPVSRGLWGQLNGGPRIALNALQPGDTVFFANTYMPGLSHAGIYIGGGRFIHASDESSGVKISGLSDSYWGPRYIGASRLH
jgi:cell wall-associated NlpC family hydrolase